jgi:hypothetical protein
MYWKLTNFLLICTGFDAILGSRTERCSSVVELQATTVIVL